MDTFFYDFVLSQAGDALASECLENILKVSALYTSILADA